MKRTLSGFEDPYSTDVLNEAIVVLSRCGISYDTTEGAANIAFTANVFRDAYSLEAGKKPIDAINGNTAFIKGTDIADTVFNVIKEREGFEGLATE